MHIETKSSELEKNVIVFMTFRTNIVILRTDKVVLRKILINFGQILLNLC